MKKERIIGRAVFAVIIVFLCVTALYVRRSWGSDSFFARYYPDTAWTMAVYCGFGLLFNKGCKLNFPAALIFSYAIEISQLFSPPFLVAARKTLIGGLIFGYGFLWSDIVCYTVGAVICLTVEIIINKTISKRSCERNV